MYIYTCLHIYIYVYIYAYMSTYLYIKSTSLGCKNIEIRKSEFVAKHQMVFLWNRTYFGLKSFYAKNLQNVLKKIQDHPQFIAQCYNILQKWDIALNKRKFSMHDKMNKFKNNFINNFITNFKKEIAKILQFAKRSESIYFI